MSFNCQLIDDYTGWPKEVSRYTKWSINRINSY